MKKVIDKNYRIASNLFFAYSISGLILILLSPNPFDDHIYLAACIIMFLLLVGFGLLIRMGLKWTKYVLLLIIIVGAYNDFPTFILTIQRNPIHGIANIIQQIVLIIIVVLLFKTNSRQKKTSANPA